MGAYQGALNLFDRNLCQVAQYYGYSRPNQLILAGEEITLQQQYPQVWNNILSCRHMKDRRTPMEYAGDLVASWLVEDYFLQLLQQAGCKVQASGADRMREILPNTRVSTTSDFSILRNGAVRRVEFMCDYTGYWQRSGRIDLRDNKYLNLQKEQSLFLGADLTNRKGILLDFSGDLPGVSYSPLHRPWGKPAYHIPCRGQDFFPLDPNILAQQLNKV